MFVPIDDVPKLTPARLNELKEKKLPRLAATDMLHAGEGGDPTVQAELMAAAEEYFKHFVKTEKKGRCINCDHQLTGQLFCGSFVWGLAHGEGFCGVCRYPARGIHRIEGVGTLSNYVLQYHPDELELAITEKPDAEANG